MKKYICLFSLAVFLIGCSNENEDIPIEEKVEVIEQTSEEQFIKELEQYKTQNYVKNFSNTVQEINKAGYIENEEIIAIIDSFIKQLIAENDMVLLKTNYPKIVNMNVFIPDDKFYFRDFMRSGSDEKLDEMELALKEKDYPKVGVYYNDQALKNNAEASAMYNYSLYLKTDQNSYDASYALALTVHPSYTGRFGDEIKEAVMNTSYASSNSTQKPIDKYAWASAGQSTERVKPTRQQRLYDKSESKTSKYAPKIHMTDHEVLDSTWGKPVEVKRTTTEYGVREQWIYSNGKYLYFEEGSLTTMQE